MLPRLLEIQSERERQRQIIAAALERLTALDSEAAILITTISADPPPQELMFHDNDEIEWNSGRARFAPATFRLIQELWYSETKFISKADVRQDVMYDDEAKEGTVRKCLCMARKEIKKSKFPYTIDTVKAKGYSMKKALPNVTKKQPKHSKRGNGW